MKAVRCKNTNPTQCPHHGDSRANELETMIIRTRHFVQHPTTSDNQRMTSYSRLQKLNRLYNATDKGYRTLIQKLTYETDITKKNKIKQLLTEASLLRAKQEPENSQTETNINAVVAVLQDDLKEQGSKHSYRQYPTGRTNKTFLVETPQGTDEILVAPTDKSSWYCTECGLFITIKNQEEIQTQPAFHNIICTTCTKLIQPDLLPTVAIRADHLRYIENSYLTQNSTWYTILPTNGELPPILELHTKQNILHNLTLKKEESLYRINFPQATKIDNLLYTSYNQIIPDDNSIYRILDNITNPGSIKLYAYKTKPHVTRIENL